MSKDSRMSDASNRPRFSSMLLGLTELVSRRRSPSVQRKKPTNGSVKSKKPGDLLKKMPAPRKISAPPGLHTAVAPMTDYVVATSGANGVTQIGVIGSNSTGPSTPTASPAAVRRLAENDGRVSPLPATMRHPNPANHANKENHERQQITRRRSRSKTPTNREKYANAMNLKSSIHVQYGVCEDGNGL